MHKYEFISDFHLIGFLKIVSDGVSICEIYPVKMPQQPTDNDLQNMPQIIQQCVAELNEYLQGKRTMFSFSMNQSGTPFQRRVWQELEKIPCGETISYAELAKRIGNPKAVRAVGSANGKNKLIIVVPCHRVINTNGGLGGYSAGLENKRILLDLERSQS